MLTFEQIKELIELVSSHRLKGVELERSGFRLRIDGEPAAPPATAARPAPPTGMVAVPPTAGSPVPAPATTLSPRESGLPGSRPPGSLPPVTTETSSAELPAGAHILSSPIVGTYYTSPNPDAKPYVRIGDRVEQGQVLCIVEAMKLMNEIESDVDGVVLEIYPANGQPVEYGERLFAIQPG